MDKRNSVGFFSGRLACRSSDSSYNSSLVTVDYQLHFLPLTFFVHANLLIWYTRGTAAYYIACNQY